MKAQFVTLFLLVAALNTPTKATTPCPNSGSQASILPASTSIIIYPTPSSSISPQSSSAAVAAQSSSLPIPTTQSPIVYSTPASTQSSSASVAAQSSSLPASTSQSTIVYPIPSSSTSSAQSSSASVAAQSSSVPAPTSTSIPYLAPSISSSSSVAPVLTSSTPIYVLPSPTISPSVLPTSSIAPTTTSTTPAPYVIPTPTPFTCTSAAASPANATTFSKTTFTSASCQRLCDPISGATCTYANNVCTCKSLDKSRRYDPLIFDLNKDSFVTAVTGSGGIDLNEDNIGDASVAEGDGMLALYSHDPSQHDVAINITGVFGTDTYNPFVKRVMKTPNGFEALFTLAIWAQVDNPAKKIIDNENVYMNALDDALKTVNYGIGFFVKTGANTKKDIVSLGDVSIVRRKYIARVDRSAEFLQAQYANEHIQFIEEGRWVDKNGNEHKCADFWVVPATKDMSPVQVRFGGDDPSGVFAKAYPDVVEAQQLLKTYVANSSGNGLGSNLFGAVVTVAVAGFSLFVL